MLIQIALTLTALKLISPLPQASGNDYQDKLMD